MTSNVVIMFTVGEYVRPQAEVSVPMWRQTASRWGCDFHTISNATQVIPTMEKLRLGTVLKHYERALMVDVDTIASPSAPNPFYIVPDTHLGAMQEWPSQLPEMYDGCRQDFRNEYDMVQEAQGMPVIPMTTRFNSGVVLASQGQRHLFKEWAHDMPCGKSKGHTLEESWLNVLVRHTQTPLYDMGWEWNTMRHYTNAYAKSVAGLTSHVYHVSGEMLGHKVSQMMQLRDRLYPPTPTRLPLSVICEHRGSIVERQGCACQHKHTYTCNKGLGVSGLCVPERDCGSSCAGWEEAY